MFTRYMDGRTDGQGDSYIPPKLCLRGLYNKEPMAFHAILVQVQVDPEVYYFTISYLIKEF